MEKKKKKGDFSRRSIQLLQLHELVLANGLLQAKLSGVTSGSMQLKQLCLFHHSAPFLGHMFQVAQLYDGTSLNP